MNIMTSKGMLNIPTSKDDVYSRGVLKYDITVDLYTLSLLKKDGSRVVETFNPPQHPQDENINIMVKKLIEK